jgi:tetratricopeptide (TPR) repeat protein
LAALAVLAAGGVVAAVVLAGLPAGRGHRPAAVAHRHQPAPASRSARTPASHTTQPAARAPRLPPTPVPPALATELEARGHDLLLAGRYRDAVPVLDRAVLATGQRPGDCLEPASQACLTYTYALYDLGRALRRSGNPAAAVPILERRLQIDNQRGTVQADLALARQQAG